MKKSILIAIVSMIALILVGSTFFFLIRKPMKPIVQTNPKIQTKPKENWVLTIPDKESCNFDKEHHFLLAKIDKGMTVVYDKNISNGTEKTEHEFSAQFPDSSEPLIDLSPDENRFAFVTMTGLTLMDRRTKQEQLLEKNITKKQDNKYSYSYINKIKWSYDAKYLLFVNIGFEWNQVGIYDMKNQSKFFPKGDGELSGSNSRWSPTENTFLDSCSTTAYDHFPGLYLSEPNNLEKFKNLAPLLNLTDYVFYDAIFSPDGKQIAYHGYQSVSDANNLVPGKSYDKQLHIYDLQSKELKLVDTIAPEDLIDSLFYSPSGSHLYYSVRGPEKTTVCSYNMINQNKKVVFTIETGPNEIVDTKWINESQLVLEIIGTERWTFVNSQIIALDLLKQELMYASNRLGSFLKILSVNNKIS